MAIIEIAKIQVRRGEENVTGMPQLDPGELGWAEDTENLYIGKRIIEGATNDNNSRILTEKDIGVLRNDLGAILKSVLNTSGSTANTATYKYRALDAHIHATTSSIAFKLDNHVSLTDYGVRASSTPVDITSTLTNALRDLYLNSGENSTLRKDARRKLMIPAGKYYITDAVELPPHTSLVGEGQELTILSLSNTITNMFKTIDALGNTFESGLMVGGTHRSREVSIQGMTLQYEYTPSNSSTPALLSLDNVLDARVEDVMFKTLSTATTGGIGIAVRGTTSTNIASGDAVLAENFQINRCKFDALYTGVDIQGNVVRPVLTNNVLSNLDRGVKLYDQNALFGPANGLLSNNRFKSIVREGIWVGASSNRTMHVSENNYFVQVGNGAGFDDFITTSTNATPVITFLSQGNKTINDYFNRRAIANTTTDATFYYNPLVKGRTTIDDTATFIEQVNTTTNSNQGITNVAKIPLTGIDQMVTLRYQLTNKFISRKGNIIVNISDNGASTSTRDVFTSLTDTYNFSSSNSIEDEYVTTATAVFSFTPSSTQFVVNITDNPLFYQVIGQTPLPGNPRSTDQTWFIVDPTQDNNAALINSFVTATVVTVLGTTSTIAVFDTQSSPVMNFNTNTVFILSRAVAVPVVINATTNVNKNYVTVTAKNASTETATISELELNVNILQ
jgi:hypothetical protein